MDHNLLVSELQALVVESKRRNPEVRDAGEAALEVLRSGAGRDGGLAAHADKLLAPVMLGCRTKNAKIVGISIAALQRLVALGGVPLSSLPEVLSTLGSVSGQAVDIQLKILQTLLAILTYCKDMHGDVLGTALLLCFKLQDSRVLVVSSTAAATLRQAIMVVFDRLGAERVEPGTPVEPTEADPADDARSPLTLTLGSGEDAKVVHVSPAAMDGYCILSDLCLLTGANQASSGLSLWSHGDKEKPRLLKLTTLQRTFGLELIESILSGYETVVKQHAELLYLLRHALHPLILRIKGEKPSFPTALRICRIIYVLIRSYADQLPAEVEHYLVSLLRAGAGDEEEKKERKKDLGPPWLQVLELEIIRGISADPVLLRAIWEQYDTPDGPKLFAKLVASLGHLINQKPELLGVGTQMHGIGVPPQTAAEHANAPSGYFDIGIGMMASAASVGVSTVSAMMGSGGGLNSTSAPKQRLIEQHDKAEAPVVPETYICLLAVQSLDAIAESISSAAAQPESREAAKGMADSAWPALLAALSYTIATDLSDTLFAEVLTALHDFTLACGTLGLSTPRDAFLTTLARYAVPPPVVSAMQSYLDTPKSGGGVMSGDALGLGAALGVGGPTGPPALSERNLACLRSLIDVAHLLASSLGPGWHDVLETLQNANYLLSSPRRQPPKRPGSSAPGTPVSTSARMSMDSPRPELLQDLDMENIQASVNALFDRSRELPDEAFTTFVTALCNLSAEMIGMDNVVDLTDTPSLLPSSMDAGRRRTSGLHITQSIKSGERSFGLAKLRTVTTLNLKRLVTRDPSIGWTAISQHLLAVARHVTAPSSIRLQASDTLAELLLASLRGSQEAGIQHQVFDVLVRQVDVNPVSNTLVTDYDVRAAGYVTLNQILESSGHSLVVGWPTIFGMLNAVCKRPEREGTQGQLQRGDANLVRIAFPSLTLICTDFLSSLDAEAMRQCIACLGYFGRQQDDVNITLAAIGLLWTVSDAVQGGDSKELWLYLLTELLELARDPRLEVRSSAMQTLFRCIEQNGSRLSPELWEEVFWKVVFPFLETLRSDESQVLALTSVGSVFGNFLPQISALPSATKVYQHLLDRLKRSFISEPRQCSTAALKVLERVLSANEGGSTLLDPTWDTFSSMGGALSEGELYTQENLVALVRVASLLHDRLEWTDDRGRELSTILRSVVEYSKSPDYRPDVDVMSPLQQAVGELVAKSNKFGPSLVLSDLAEFSSLAYLGADDNGAGKRTYIALSKFAMPAMADIFVQHKNDGSLYADGTVEAVLGAYALPIKLKYDCPPASKYGSDPPLWRTAMWTFARVLDAVMPVVETQDLPTDRYAAIWAQVMDVFSGVLLADADEHMADGENGSTDDETFVLPILDRLRAAVIPRLTDKRVPDHVLRGYAETLRKASILYHYDVPAHGGTTAPVVPETQERTRYWAFDQLVAGTSRRKPNRRTSRGSDEGKAEAAALEQSTDESGDGAEADEASEGARRVAAHFAPSLLGRFDTALRQFLDDAKLRGHMPFARVREDELLYVLRQLAVLEMWPGSCPGDTDGTASDDGRGDKKLNGASSEPHTPTTKSPASPLALAAAASPRAHLFRYYARLIELSFISARLPSMWVLPAEHAVLFGGEVDEDADADAGDGSALIEVGARDLARRCLELIGEELGLA